jgi:hypothetical protein
MRSGINDNPVVQAALIGLLVLVMGFILVTRVMGGGGGEESSAPPPTATAGAAPAPAGEAAAPATGAPTDPAAADPATSGSTAPVPGAEGESTAPSLEAGKGMPEAVVEAYDANDVVVLLVVDNGAIDDKRVEEATKVLEARSDVALFQTDAKDVSDYSQITNGIGLNRTPALVVMRPKDLSDEPVATVSYGYRSLESVNQAVENALYDGKKAPYYPE